MPREGHEASEAASVLAAREVHGACEAAATSEANAASFLPLHIGSCRRQYSVRRAVPPARLAPRAHLRNVRARSALPQFSTFVSARRRFASEMALTNV